MWEVFYTMAATLGSSVEWLIVIIALLLGSLVFFATDFQKGLVAFMLLSAGIFIWFYAEGLNYAVPLTLLLMDIAIMALTQYMTTAQVKGGIY